MTMNNSCELPWAESQLNGLGKVKGRPSCRLHDLLTTTEAIRDDQGIRRRSPYGGQQQSLAYPLRDREVVCEEAGRAGPSAPAPLDRPPFGPHLPDERLFGRQPQQGFGVRIAGEPD